MKRSLPLLLSLVVPLVLLAGALLASMAFDHPIQVLQGAPLALADARASSPYDSRPCVQHPSPATCNGVFPEAPASSHQGANQGRGACADGHQRLLETDPLLGQGDKHIGVLQIVFFPTCGTYSAHVTYQKSRPDDAATAEVDVYDPNGFVHALDQFATWLGDEEIPSPTEVEKVAQTSDHDFWSPMVYAPTATVQAVMQIGGGNNPTSGAGPDAQASFTDFYTVGIRTTIDGRPTS